MSVKQIDRTTGRMIQQRMLSALEGLGKELGVKFELGRGSLLSTTAANFSFKASVISADGTVETVERSDFLRFHQMFGLDKEDLGRSFNCRGKVFKVVGLLPNCPRYCVLCERADGRRVKFPAEDVKQMLGGLAKAR